MPPWSLHHCVYTALPTGTSMRAVLSSSSTTSESGPSTVNLANEVWSNRATRSRTARHSSPALAHQFCLP